MQKPVLNFVQIKQDSLMGIQLMGIIAALKKWAKLLLLFLLLDLCLQLGSFQVKSQVWSHFLS